MIYNKIEIIRKSKNIGKTEFYKAIGMSTTGFLQMVENNSMKITTLQKIANVLSVPISVFFEDENARDVLEIKGFDLETALSLEAEKVATKLGQQEGLPEKEIIKLMARQIAILKLQADIANDLAQMRLNKIEELQSGDS